MSDPLAKSYSPAEHEDAIRARWDSARVFHAEPANSPPTGAAAPFCILIPPPNVTAALHLGHAFNNTLQDILTRYHRMRGYNTLWMPGTDHASIGTQAVIERRLALQGKKRTDFTREQFIAIVQEWKDEYEATIIEQLKVMGCSCDFERTRFTMDEMCSKAVREAFFRLFKDGRIYRGKRLVNWDPVLQTAVADDEVYMEEVQGHMWYLRYPLEPLQAAAERSAAAGQGESRAQSPSPPTPLPEGEGSFITVATTRPETMLGDTAVAVNPKDPYASQFIGRKVRLPIVDRIVPIIGDDYVAIPVERGGDENDPKAKIATGFLKVTPAHDPNDWEIGQRHSLSVINVFAPDATISDKHGWTDVSPEAKQFLSRSREAARDAVVKWFKDQGLLESVKDYIHSVGHSDRSGVAIEPWLSDQWYVRVTDDRMRGEALRAMAPEQREGEAPQRAGTSSSRSALNDSPSIRHADVPARSRAGDGELRFYPARYARTFQHWHENLRDWCISRQLWWGHRIPVWSFRLHYRGEIETTPDAAYTPAFDALVAGLTKLCVVQGGAADHLHFVRTDYATGHVCARTSEASEAVRTFELRWNSIRGSVFTPGQEREISYAPVIDLEAFSMARQSLNSFEQDPDVLDTWFSSGLWPISTMGWPDPAAFPETKGLLETFNPSTVLSTAREIITLWVSRMVMFNRYFRDGVVPFHDVFIHAIIQDGHGQKMSKSLGNGVDPRDIIHSHGADAMRFILAQMATNTQDVRLPVDMVCPHCGEVVHPKEITTQQGYRVAAPEQECPKCKRKMISGYGAASGLATPTKDVPLARNTSSKFDLGRNFSNKLWNAARFALSNLYAKAVGLQSHGFAELALVDRWMLTRLHHGLRAVDDAIRGYQFNAYAEAMYDLVWRDFCDWYLEAIKPTVKSSPVQQQVLRTVLNAILRMLHPVCPFVTEALWPHVRASGAAGLSGIELPENDLLATAAWPVIDDSIADERAAGIFQRVQALTDQIRNLRGEHKVQPRKKIHLHATEEIRELIERSGAVVSTLAGLEGVTSIDADAKRQAAAVVFMFEGREQYLSGLVGAVDAEAERARLAKLVEDKVKSVSSMQGRLNNAGYVAKAPPTLVEETRSKLAEAEADLAAARKALESLGV